MSDLFLARIGHHVGEIHGICPRRAVLELRD
jgi:hypothetical protein